jgi:Transglycosylase SLT domain
VAARRGATRRRPATARARGGRAAARLSASTCILYLVYALIGVVGANFIYQVIRKPTELFFPISGALYKTPEETWRVYARLFRRYATPHVSAPLLAALAQVEGSGNPLVRTYWHWAAPARLFDFYRPASSAVGMYQITDSTFAEARHYCIHDHQLTHEGPWNDWHSCWFNRLYLRVLPRDAVELTAADLELRVAGILATVPRSAASPAQLQHLAAVVHLCGAGAADLYARRGFRFSAGQRCGEHDPREYLARVDSYSREFSRLEARESGTPVQ